MADSRLTVDQQSADSFLGELFFIFSLRRVYTFILDLFGQSSPQEDGLFGSEGAPFRQNGGLFSGGGNLFDDEDGEKVCNCSQQLPAPYKRLVDEMKRN